MSQLTIQIVSDVVCPWCVVGNGHLQQALEKMKQTSLKNTDVKITWLPFQLNPTMPKEGQNIYEHLTQKYGAADFSATQNQLLQLGKGFGFEFNFNDRSRIYNTFDAHLLLSQAENQHALQMKLFEDYFTKGKDISNYEVLVEAAASVGLDESWVKGALDNSEARANLAAELENITNMGVHSVPTFIINNKYSISGGQPAQAFEQALTQIMSSSDS